MIPCRLASAFPCWRFYFRDDMGLRTSVSVILIPILLSAAMLLFTHFYMHAKARRAGIRIDWAEDPEEFPRASVLRYREIAENTNLPMWPYHAHIVAFWSLWTLGVLWFVEILYCDLISR